MHWLLRSGMLLIGSLSLLTAAEPAPSKKADPAPKSTPAEKTKPATVPVIGYLETRDRVIALKAGAKYTVTTKAGKVLAEDIGLDKLQASYPDLYKLVNGAVAKDGSFQHAGLRLMAN
ncbi:MAG: hypothetical protein KGS61_05850 [Verrucomicrobia bacterium]|nr:hypothetical protein [Verrucomicrobiota bacterium]